MAPLTDDEELLRSCFRQLKELRKQFKRLNLDYAPCTGAFDGNVE